MPCQLLVFGLERYFPLTHRPGRGEAQPFFAKQPLQRRMRSRRATPPGRQHGPVVGLLSRPILNGSCLCIFTGIAKPDLQGGAGCLLENDAGQAGDSHLSARSGVKSIRLWYGARRTPRLDLMSDQSIIFTQNKGCSCCDNCLAHSIRDNHKQQEQNRKSLIFSI